MKYVVAVVALLFANVASAQSVPGVFGGYVFAHPDFADIHLSAGDSLNGWLAGVELPLAGQVGVVARVDGAYGDSFRQGLVVGPGGNEARPALSTFAAGPRAAITRNRLTLFADALAGVAHGKARVMGVDFLRAATDSGFAAGAGGGVDVRVSRTVDLRGDVQYRRAHLLDQTLNLVEVGASVVFRPTRH
jgi:hypothetical protein